MNILNIKKYIFSYIYIVLGITIVISYFAMDIFFEPSPDFNTLEPIPSMLRSSTFTMLYLGSSILYLFSCIALFIEILIYAIFRKNLSNTKSIQMSKILIKNWPNGTTQHSWAAKN